MGYKHHGKNQELLVLAYAKIEPSSFSMGSGQHEPRIDTA